MSPLVTLLIAKSSVHRISQNVPTSTQLILRARWLQATEDCFVFLGHSPSGRGALLHVVRDPGAFCLMTLHLPCLPSELTAERRTESRGAIAGRMMWGRGLSGVNPLSPPHSSPIVTCLPSKCSRLGTAAQGAQEEELNAGGGRSISSRHPRTVLTSLDPCAVFLLC